MQGGRISLAIGVTAMAISITLGTLIGLLSGYFARLDGLLMRLTDMFLSLPLLPLLLVITMLFRDPLRKTFGTEAGIFILTVTIIGALNWMTTARSSVARCLRSKSANLCSRPEASARRMLALFAGTFCLT